MDGETTEEANEGETFEGVLESIDSMGAAQVMIILLSIAIECTVGMTVNYFVLESGPHYSCLTLSDALNSSSYGAPSVLSCTNSTAACYNETVPDLGKCPSAGKACTNVTYLDDYTSIVTEWNLTCDKYYLVKLTASIYFAGLLVGAIIGGQLSDMLGRRPILLAAWTGLIAAQACLAAVTLWPVYAALRFIVGLFAGCCATVATILPMEYVGMKWRIFVAMRLGWGISHFLLPLVAYFLRPWQHLALGSSLPFAPFLLLSFVFLPESSRWLLQKQKYDVAFKWLKFVARINRRPPPDSAIIRRIGKSYAEAQKAAGHYTYANLFASKTYALRSTVLMLGWFTCSMVSYGLKSQWASLTGSIYINMAIAAAANVCVRIAAPFIFSKTGRRPSYALSMAIPVVAMFSILAMDLAGYMKGREMVRTWLALVSYAVGVGCWISVFIITMEIYPTLIRNIASGAGNTSARVAGVLAPQVGLLKVFHPSLPYIIFGTMAVGESILMTVFMPETKNKPLPEEPPPRFGKKDQEAGRRDIGEDKAIVVGSYVLDGEERTNGDIGLGVEMALMGNGSDFALRRPDRNT
ncbi:solute carrier family 22 member 15-like [Lineus longissimus]|uniref:solute carrier family 22 member 15-like n=1 Tax=Lineus longissimus TaxID=88925 RepID=UPI00315DA4FC